jgi:GntR family transcriptional regulator, transcriptional repressor for pyruvate dehydrogenase complex
VRNPTPFDIPAVLVPKASDVLADRLRALILDEGLPEGTPLPTERELVAQSGLGRGSVREALRMLEVEGLIVTKAGRNGGSEIRRPSREAISRSFELFLRSHGVRFDALIEARESVEPAAARLAALHRTDEDIAAITEIQRELEGIADNIAKFAKTNLRWHQAVVKASKNELLITFIDVISRPIYAATEYQGMNTSKLRREVVHVHGRVLEAIIKQDGEAAFRRMERHMNAYSKIANKLVK